jgi:2-dehydro-3-deoxyphosphooctonate aldolase (KDO 8-P synthase)
MSKKVVLNINGRSPIQIGEDLPLAIIAGPCVIESREHALSHAQALSEICGELSLPLIYKSSYDKANRTSLNSFRGVQLEKGLEILAEVKSKFNIPIITDVHSELEAKLVGEVADILQVPAFLCRQTDLLIACGKTTQVVMIKKGQFLAPEDMRYAGEKVLSAGASGVMLCERGSSFGYRDLIVDFRSLDIMAEFGWPVVFDATHSVQVIGGKGGSSGGNRHYVPILARAAVAAGVNAVFLECHENPDVAPSDGPNMLPLKSVKNLLEDLKKISELQLNTRNNNKF